MKKKKNREKNFYSYKKLWTAYKIARRNNNFNERTRLAKKIMGVARGLYKKGLIEKLPEFTELVAIG